MKDNTKAVCYILLSALAFTLMSTVVKLAKDIPTYEKVFFRNFINLIVAIYIIKKGNISFWGEKKNRKFLVIRGLLGLTGVMFNFYTIVHMSLADSNLLFNLTPFFVTLFAYFFLKQKIIKFEIMALIVAFSSVLLVIKPQFDMSILSGLAGVMGAACSGGAYTLVSHINKRENPATIVFYLTFVSVIIISPFVFFDFVVPKGVEWLWLLGTGIFATIGQFMVTLAYKYGKPSEVAIYNYTSIVFAMIMGFLVWGEVPDILSSIGAILLIGTGVTLYFKKKKIIKSIV